MAHTDAVADAPDGPKHILVVNDTEEILELFRDIVEGMGHTITATSFAPDDLEQVAKVNPDLAVLDLMVGGEGHGWQLLQKIKMSPETADLPVIVCTAAADSVREQEGWLAAKAVKVVLKPFEVDNLERAINKALKLPDLVS